MSEAAAPADPERALALAYAPAATRGALSALFRLDERLSEIVRSTTEPMIGQMRLTWWHTALTALGEGAPPAEPLLAELDALVRGGALEAAALATIVEGWEELLQPLPLDRPGLDAYALRGHALFGCAARVLGGDVAQAGRVGRGWALTDLAFHVSDRDTAARALELARETLTQRRGLPRTLAVLAALAERDACAGIDRPRRPGSPARVARALWHGVTGR